MEIIDWYLIISINQKNSFIGQFEQFFSFHSFSVIELMIIVVFSKLHSDLVYFHIYYYSKFL
jgi:hypothetical protein